jgi:hypothetical protein
MSLGVRLAAACLLAAAAGVVLPSPAEAGTCASADGVSVVVDFHELSGGVQTACVSDGGGSTAAALFDAAGFSVDRVQRQQGFVCRVSGKPATDPCVNTPPADAYWGLWWSDGTSGQWTYATRGVDSQTFSWNGSTSRSAPGVSPARHPAPPAPTPSSTPKPKPSTQPSNTPKPTKNPARPTPSTPGPTSSASPSASVSDSPSAVETTPSGAVGKPTKSPGGVDGEMLPESDAPAPESLPAASEPADASGGGLPTWVGPVVVVLLFAAGGAVAVVRRRGKPAP